MKKNVLGLAILGVVIIVAVVLWRLYVSGPATVGPVGPVATSPPAAAPPEAKPSTHPQLPAAPPIKTEPTQGIAPMQEPGHPGSNITIPLPPEMKEHYGILAGSYRNYQEAAKMLATLKKQGKPAFVQRDPKNLNFFEVWLGPFSSQPEAQIAAKKMHAKFKKSYKIEPIENPVPK